MGVIILPYMSFRVVNLISFFADFLGVSSV